MTMAIEGFGVHLPAANESGQGYLEYRVLQQEAQDYFQGCNFEICFGVIYESKCGASKSQGEACYAGPQSISKRTRFLHNGGRPTAPHARHEGGGIQRGPEFLL